jgi:hypothetical protein
MTFPRLAAAAIAGPIPVVAAPSTTACSCRSCASCREEHPIAHRQRRPTRLSARHRDLVPEHHNLKLLELVRAQSQRQKLQRAAERQIAERPEQEPAPQDQRDGARLTGGLHIPDSGTELTQPTRAGSLTFACTCPCHRDIGCAAPPAAVSPLRAGHVRSIWRSIAGYTIRCRNGLITAMYAVPNHPFGFTRTAI